MTLLATSPRVEVKANAGAHGPSSIPTRTPGPLRRVVAALEAGADTRGRLELATGLDRDVVDSALDHLERLGWVRSEPLASGCPGSGCGPCPSARPDGPAGCGALTRSGTRGPVVVTLVGRRSG